jgi:hypothetical protein
LLPQIGTAGMGDSHSNAGCSQEPGSDVSCSQGLTCLMVFCVSSL